jgi:hypothetical protein
MPISSELHGVATADARLTSGKLELNNRVQIALLAHDAGEA